MGLASLEGLRHTGRTGSVVTSCRIYLRAAENESTDRWRNAHCVKIPLARLVNMWHDLPGLPCLGTRTKRPQAFRREVGSPPLPDRWRSKTQFVSPNEKFPMALR